MVLCVPPRKTVPGRKLNIFGGRLRELRLARGLTVRATAAKLQAKGWDLTETALGHIEAGRRSITDAELVILLRLFGAKLSDLE